MNEIINKVFNEDGGIFLKFTMEHRSILHATKSKNNNFYKDQVFIFYQNPTGRRI
jgi:hypothetical protein